MRQKTCKLSTCKKKFTPERPMQTTCHYSCAIEYSKELKEKRARKAKQEYKRSDIQELKKIAQVICNKYIRLRDQDKPCISCGYVLNNGNRQVHAGHYIAQGKSSLLRYDERNIHAQCAQCNTFLHGNLAEYRINLIQRAGIETVETLENITDHTRQWKAWELKEIIDTFKAKTKELDNG